MAAARSLSELSERGRIVPELDDPQVRELLLARYRLVYEVLPDRVAVLAGDPCQPGLPGRLEAEQTRLKRPSERPRLQSLKFLSQAALST